MSEQPRTPVLFVSHGSPLFALNPGQTGPALQHWAAEQAPADRIKGIVLISPHWMTRRPAVTARAQQEAWHDGQRRLN